MADETIGYCKSELEKIPELNLKTFCGFVAHLAFEVEEKTGIYHLVPIVQAAHESRNGNSGLARKYCNLFGITATDAWKKEGRPIAAMPTWEMIGGKKVDTVREFRAYFDWRESFQDWAKLISGLSIYKPAYTLLKDKSTTREGIRAMGKLYATDDQYAQKLLGIYDAIAPNE